MKLCDMPAAQEILESHAINGATFLPVDEADAADITVNATELLTRTIDSDLRFFLPALQEKYWFVNHDYAGKLPLQQWRMRAGSLVMDVYDYHGQLGLEGEIQELVQTIAVFQSHFPIPDEMAPKSIAVIDKFRRSPTNMRSHPILAEAAMDCHSFTLAAGKEAFSREPWNPDIPLRSNRAVVIHELAHFALDKIIREAWQEVGFTWQPILTPVLRKHAMRDGYHLYKADRPKDSITDYAAYAPHEDIAESTVAYLGRARGKLHREKRRILREHDQELAVPPQAIFRRRPAIPQLPKRIHYYVKSK